MSSSKSDGLLSQIRQSIIGAHHEIDGPFGHRLVTYADYTASGRSLSFIEDFIRDHVMPYYANTHTESSSTGLQTGRFREDAREIIKAAVGGGPDDVLIFCGSGATSAINKLVDILNLRLPSDLEDRYGFLEMIPESDRPVVFIGPYEHHSNELPWRESIAEVVVIDEDEDGKPDRALLRQELERYSDRPLLIGSFSAASNVTGIGAGTQEISAILHSYGALAFWDFAAAAPYVTMEMSPDSDDPDDCKDAIFISPHKFIGGPGTPGILVVKRELVRNAVPTMPGGGTVSYVGPTEHRYLDDPEHREEGGTPAIIESIRAGLVFQLKETVGSDRIRELEDHHIGRAIEHWSGNEDIQILGNKDAWRLSIVSFLIRHNDQYLHHNFVVSLLNDLFGLQVRGGCSCAGPYGHRLLGIDVVESLAFQREIERGCEGIKPGWARVNFNYFMAEDEFEFVLKAIDFVAAEGWKLLPLYRFEADAGLWFHRYWERSASMRLHDIQYNNDGRLQFPHQHSEASASPYDAYLKEAHRLVAEIEASAIHLPPPTRVTEDFEALRWFPLPSEALEELLESSESSPNAPCDGE